MTGDDHRSKTKTNIPYISTLHISLTELIKLLFSTEFWFKV